MRSNANQSLHTKHCIENSATNDGQFQMSFYYVTLTNLLKAHGILLKFSAEISARLTTIIWFISLKPFHFISFVDCQMSWLTCAKKCSWHWSSWLECVHHYAIQWVPILPSNSRLRNNCTTKEPSIRREFQCHMPSLM